MNELVINGHTVAAGWSHDIFDDRKANMPAID